MSLSSLARPSYHQRSRITGIRVTCGDGLPKFERCDFTAVPLDAVLTKRPSADNMAAYRDNAHATRHRDFAPHPKPIVDQSVRVNKENRSTRRVSGVWTFIDSSL